MALQPFRLPGPATLALFNLPLSPFPVIRTFFRLTPTPPPSPLRSFSTHPSPLDTLAPPQPLCGQSHPHAFRHTWGCASVFTSDFELSTPYRSSRKCPHQYHSAPLSRPLFSYSYALFCTAQTAIFHLFISLRTLRRKHPEWGRPHASNIRTFPSSNLPTFSLPAIPFRISSLAHAHPLTPIESHFYRNHRGGGNGGRLATSHKSPVTTHGLHLRCDSSPAAIPAQPGSRAEAAT